MDEMSWTEDRIHAGIWACGRHAQKNAEYVKEEEKEKKRNGEKKAKERVRHEGGGV